MKNNPQATHDHKRAGPVVLLESTAVLAKVWMLVSREEFWVKLSDLTPLIGGVIEKSKPGKKQLGENRVRMPLRKVTAA